LGSKSELVGSILDEVEAAALLRPVSFPILDALDMSNISTTEGTTGSNGDVNFPAGAPTGLSRLPLLSTEDSTLADAWWQGEGPRELGTPRRSCSGSASLRRFGWCVRRQAKGLVEFEVPDASVGAEEPETACEQLGDQKEGEGLEGEEEEGEEEESLAERLGALWLAPNPPSPSTSQRSRRASREGVQFTPGGHPQDWEEYGINVSPIALSPSPSRSIAMGGALKAVRKLSFGASHSPPTCAAAEIFPTSDFRHVASNRALEKGTVHPPGFRSVGPPGCSPGDGAAASFG